MLGKYIAYRLGKKAAYKRLEKDLEYEEKLQREEQRRILISKWTSSENGQYPNHE